MLGYVQYALALISLYSRTLLLSNVEVKSSNMTLFNPLSKDEIHNLFTEINGVLEAEFEDDTSQRIQQKKYGLPTVDKFEKLAILQLLRSMEPNSFVFYQDIQKLIQTYLEKNVVSFESEDAEYLMEKYLVNDRCCNVDSRTITLRRITALFPSLTCSLLKCNTHIARPISQYDLNENENYPRSMTSRCFFSLIPTTPMIGKLKIIEAALLYQLLEQAKFNTLKMENGQVNYAQHMQICLDYCSDDYLSEFETNEKRIQHYNELDIMKDSYPIHSVYEAAQRLQKIVGNKWTNEIIKKFNLIGLDFD